jgi:catechol 2,3-dioxygenase-like lactoylglutathione lyase family enzyme
MARIKHIAIRTHDVDATAAFYRDVFDLKEVGAGQSGVYLSDGYLNIAILKLRPGSEGETLKLGLDHVGFQVDNLDVTLARIQRLGGRSLISSESPARTDAAEGSQSQSYYEIKCLGPDAQVFDVSTTGWIGALDR